MSSAPDEPPEKYYGFQCKPFRFYSVSLKPGRLAVSIINISISQNQMKLIV